MNRPFAEMPDDARLWVFASPRRLEPSELQTVHDHVAAFVEQWTAHGAPVVGAFDLRHDQFLLVAADEAATGVSGCSIDSLTRALKGVERELGLSLLDASSRVWFRDGDGAVRALPRSDFRDRVRAGDAGEETLVFDNTVTTVGAVREARWETPMRRSWHAKAFGS